MPPLQQLLGLPGDGGSTVTAGALRFAPIVPAPLLALLGAALVLLAWRAYRRSPGDLPPFRRRSLLVLRSLFLLLLLAIALRPSLALQLEREGRRTVALLVDRSASMGIADIPGEGAGGNRTRAELVASTLADPGLALLDRLSENAEVARYTFGRDVAAGAELDPNDPETAMGDAMLDVLRRHSADDLAAVVVVGDGVSNEGAAPLEAAAELAERGVEVFAWGVGDTSSRDVSIQSLELPAVALAGDAIPLSVRVSGRGLAGERGRLQVTLAGVPAAEKEFVFDGSESQEVEAAILPERAGEFEIVATVTGPGGEVLDNNNSTARALRVLDSAIRVLMVEHAPRWEFKYIQAMLLRERRVDLDCFLSTADPEVTRLPDSPYLPEFPKRRDELFAYDLVLFGDADPRALPPDAASDIASYVSDGGGSLAVIAGPRFTPEAYRNSELAALLPVELPPSRLGTRPPATRPLRLELTDGGRAAPFLRLDPDPRRAEGRWAQLPPIFSVYPAERTKPAAVAYLQTGDGRPVLVGHRYGAGEVLWVGTDNTWRWRRNVGDLYHARFWGQVVQKLAGRRLAAGSRRTELSTGRPFAREGETVEVFARLLDSSFTPRTEATVTATLEGESGERSVTLRAVPGSPGYYRAEFAAGDAGRYRLGVPGDSGARLDVTVKGSDREFANTALDEPLLRSLAETTGGKYFSLEELAGLPALAAPRPATISVSREAALWSSPLFLVLLLLPLTAEWVVRKFSHLK